MAIPSRAFEHALVLVEKGAVPFCHYDNPHFYSAAAPQWMGEKLLRAIVRRAKKDDTALTFLLGKSRPPETLEAIMTAAAHVKIVPRQLGEFYPSALLVLSSEESGAFGDIKPDYTRNLILRLAKADLGRCGEIFASLDGKFGRLSIHLLGIEYFGEDDLAVYAGELEKISNALKKLYAAGRKIEVNVLTDRMILKTMRNCDAGEKHVTIAPDGKCYICPAFICDDEVAIGAFDEKKGFVAKPPANVEYSRAPLCTRCDAFHCKRCVYLNYKLTLEYNVPSEQQCLLAHAEREASRLALKAFGDIEPFRRLPRIVELNYRDPLELIDMQPPEFPGQSASDDPML